MFISKYSNFKFAHHHVHSEYSPWDAPVSLKKLIKYSKDLGYKTVTITDHGTVGSWVKLAYMCKEQGIKPIFGIEAYFVPDRHVRCEGRNNYHLLLIAKNKQGIRNIFRLSELAYTQGYYYDPRVDWELLEKYHEGIICTTSCVSGLVPDTLLLPPNDPLLAKIGTDGKQIYENEKPQFVPAYEMAKSFATRFKSLFGTDFYAEVQYHGLDIEVAYEGVADIAKELGLKLLATNDVHYLRKEDAFTQEAMMALRMGKCLKDAKRIKHETDLLYLKSPEEMIEAFGGPNAASIQGALEIADVCNAELELGKTQLPSIEIPKEYKSDLEYLEAIAREGLRRRGKEGNPAYEARFKEEMEVLRRLREKGRQFDRYFLVVWDYVRWAWENGIRVGAGRGSGVGSLLLYCLRITGLDPLPYGLLFERFLAEDRNEMPDIDIDFDYENGHKVYEYVQKKYGVERCARIGTLSTFHVASAIKSAFRVFDPGNTWEREQAAKQEVEQSKKTSKTRGSQRPEKQQSPRDETAALANEITKKLPQGPNGPSDKCTLLKEVYDQKPDEYEYVYDSSEFRMLKQKYPEVFSLAEKIEGLVKDRSIHAAGVLITEDELVNVCPQQFSGKAKNLSTAFDMSDIDKLGGVKFDFLRTKVLSVISRAVESIKQRYGRVIDIDDVPVDDQKALAVFARGDTLGIFQFESRGMRELLKNMNLNCFEDVIAANALYRPGPMENIPEYCARRTGKKSVSYLVPAVEPVLKNTFGLIVYQEQVMQITRVLAGFSGPEADKVRKAMGKKKKDILDQMKDKFIKGCVSKGLCQQATADSLWAELENYSRYAFNKSHSAGYSFTAYQCAWLKAHYLAEFMAAQLTVEGADACYDTISLYENGLRDAGVKLLPLCINTSSADYSVADLKDEKFGVRKGFKGIKGLGKQACEDIVAGQPYCDMFDYCLRSQTGMKSDAVTTMVDEGAFDCFLPKISKRLGREATKTDLLNEYADKGKRAQVEKRAKPSGNAGWGVEEEDVKEKKFVL